MTVHDAAVDDAAVKDAAVKDTAVNQGTPLAGLTMLGDATAITCEGDSCAIPSA